MQGADNANYTAEVPQDDTAVAPTPLAAEDADELKGVTPRVVPYPHTVHLQQPVRARQRTSKMTGEEREVDMATDSSPSLRRTVQRTCIQDDEPCEWEEHKREFAQVSLFHDHY